MSRTFEADPSLRDELADADTYNPWHAYEAAKRSVADQAQTPADYEARIAALSEELSL